MFNTREEKTVKHTNSTKGADHKSPPWRRLCRRRLTGGKQLLQQKRRRERKPLVTLLETFLGYPFFWVLWCRTFQRSLERLSKDTTPHPYTHIIRLPTHTHTLWASTFIRLWPHSNALPAFCCPFQINYNISLALLLYSLKRVPTSLLVCVFGVADNRLSDDFKLLTKYLAASHPNHPSIHTRQWCNMRVVLACVLSAMVTANGKISMMPKPSYQDVLARLRSSVLHCKRIPLHTHTHNGNVSSH
jgi:hypothetical protein